ncbi:MAG: hypothetical protein WBF88_15650 [Pusillimonas sp.]
MTDLIVVLLLFSTLVLMVAGILFFHKREGFFSVFFVFSIGLFVYFLLIPIELWIRSDMGFYTGGRYVEIGRHIVFLIAQSGMSLLFFFCGLIVGGYRFVPDKPMQTFEGNAIGVINLLFFSIFIIVSGIVFWDNIQLELESYFNVAGVAYANPLYSIIKYTILLILSVISIYYIKRKRAIGWVFIIIPFLFGVVTSDKNPMLISLISVATVFGSRIKSPKKALMLLVLIVPLLFSFLVLIRSFSFWRGGASFLDSTLRALEEFTFTRIDPASLYISIEYYLNRWDMNWGSSYIDNFTLLIPRFIMPNRPPDLAESFAQIIIDDWQMGQGVGFSPLAEAILNFQDLAFIHFLFLGIFWALFWRITYRIWKVTLPSEIFPIFYRVYGLYFLMVGFRSSSLHFFKIMPMYVIFGFFIFIVIGMWRRRHYENTLGS